MTENEMLQEIHRGAQSAVFAMDALQNKIQGQQLQQTVALHRQEMQSIASRAESEISGRHLSAEDPSVWSKTGMWAGIQMNTMMDSSDSKIAEIMIQGSTMGVTNITREMNDSPSLTPQTRRLGEELVAVSRHNIDRMKTYL